MRASSHLRHAPLCLLEPGRVSPLLELRNLGKTFAVDGGRARIHAVSDVSLALAAGEMIGIVGESGCGKSTLARLVLRLLIPTRGSIAFAGQDLLALDAGAMRAVRRNMQMVFQDPLAALVPRQRVRGSVSAYSRRA